MELFVDQNPGLGGTLPSFIGNLQSLRKFFNCHACSILVATMTLNAILLWYAAESFQVSNCGLSGTIPSQYGLMRNMSKLALLRVGMFQPLSSTDTSTSFLTTPNSSLLDAWK